MGPVGLTTARRFCDVKGLASITLKHGEMEKMKGSRERDRSRQREGAKVRGKEEGEKE